MTKIILFLFVSSTLISQSAMDAFSVIIFIFSVYFLFSTKKINIQLPSFSRLPKSKIIPWSIFFATWLLIIMIGLWDTPQFLKNFSEWKWILNLYSMYWFFQIIIQSSAEEKTSNRRLFNSILIMLILCFIYGLISFSLSTDLIHGVPLDHGQRFGGPFNDPMNYSHLYGMYFVFLVSILLSKYPMTNIKEFFEKNLLLIITSVLTGTGILLSFTRGAWIGVGISILTVSFLKNRKLGFKLLSVFFILVTILFIAWPSFHNRVLQSFNPTQSYDSERVVLWNTNWHIFLDHPLFGVGHGNYKDYLVPYFKKLNYPEDHFQSHSHNQYLQFLSNTGILGFLCYLIFIIGVLYLTYSQYRKKQNSFLLASLAAQISFHIGSITECNFERSKVRLVYLLFAALSLAIIITDKNKENSN